MDFGFLLLCWYLTDDLTWTFGSKLIIILDETRTTILSIIETVFLTSSAPLPSRLRYNCHKFLLSSTTSKAHSATRNCETKPLKVRIRMDGVPLDGNYYCTVWPAVCKTCKYD